LAERLIERLQSSPKSRILDFAAGRGRNSDALRAAGFNTVAVGDEDAASGAPLARVPGTFEAVLSTHGFLHGTTGAIAARLQAVALRLEPGGLLYATFASTRDARFGRGERIDASTFAPLEGDERGVAHVYFDRERLHALLETEFTVEASQECGVDEIAGSWAHAQRPLEGSVHWFVVARRP
jgi:hypothetical protein